MMRLGINQKYLEKWNMWHNMGFYERLALCLSVRVRIC